MDPPNRPLPPRRCLHDGFVTTPLLKGSSKEIRPGRMAHNMPSSSLMKKSELGLVSKVRCGALRLTLQNFQEVILGTKLLVLFPTIPLAFVAQCLDFGRVRTISLFGEVWGIGPATTLKLYEKGHRTLEDLQGEESLTKSQRLGLKYFDDIKTRIPRNEVAEMEKLLQEAAESLLPGVVLICGGSFRRGKSSCGDLDIIITHPNGQSHKGFLAKL